MIVDPYYWTLIDTKDMKLVQKIIGKIEKDFSESSKPMENLIDVGCGPGDITDILARKIPKTKVTGVDMAENAIIYAKEHHERDNLNYMQLDIIEDEVPENFFNKCDAVVSFHCLNNILQKRKAMTFLRKMLKDDGKLYLVLCGWLNYDALTYNIIYDKKWSEYFKGYKDEDGNVPLEFVPVQPNNEHILKFWRELCLETGYTIEHDEIMAEDKLMTLKEVTNIIKSFNPFMDKIPSERREEFLDDFRAMFESDWIHKFDRNENGKYLLKFSFLSIILSK